MKRLIYYIYITEIIFNMKFSLIHYKFTIFYLLRVRKNNRMYYSICIPYDSRQLFCKETINKLINFKLNSYLPKLVPFAHLTKIHITFVWENVTVRECDKLTKIYFIYLFTFVL